MTGPLEAHHVPAMLVIDQTSALPAWRTLKLAIVVVPLMKEYRLNLLSVAVMGKPLSMLKQPLT
jgi:hypothetical protein